MKSYVCCKENPVLILESHPDCFPLNTTSKVVMDGNVKIVKENMCLGINSHDHGLSQDFFFNKITLKFITITAICQCLLNEPVVYSPTCWLLTDSELCCWWFYNADCVCIIFKFFASSSPLNFFKLTILMLLWNLFLPL